MILVATRIEKSKNEDRTLITKTHELSDEILFDFRFRWLELPVHEKQLTSGLRLEAEVENMTMHSFRVNSIHSQSFIQIGPRVFEIIQPTPKMNAILGMPQDSSFELEERRQELAKAENQVSQNFCPKTKYKYKNILHGHIAVY